MTRKRPIAQRLRARDRKALSYGVLVVIVLSFPACHRATDEASAPAGAVQSPAEVRGPAPPPSDANVAPRAVNVPESATASRTGTAAPPRRPAAAEPWRALTRFDFAALRIDQVPPDEGNISPIAPADEAPAGSAATMLKQVEEALPAWAPGHVADRVQRVRNYLLILGVADYAQSTVERFLPGAVLAHMLKEFPRDELAQLVCWVAQHSEDGDVSALTDPLLVGLGAANLDPDEVRMRTYYYGVKLTHRIIGW